MIKFQRNAPLYRFRSLKFTKSLERRIGQIFREALRAWLRAVILKVPVKTAHSKGSLMPLGRFLRVAVPTGPTSNQTRTYSGQPDYSYKGERQSKFKIKDDRSDPGKMSFSFEWSSDVLHYYLNEYGFVHGPWRSTEDGAEAYGDHLRTHLKDYIPSVIDHIDRKYF